MIRLLMILLFLAAPAAADDLIFYAVDASMVTKSQLNILKNYGKKNDPQPFRNTYSLLATNTNYYLVAFTPQNPTEQNTLDNLIAANEVSVYQVYKFENNRMWLDQDFSDKFNLNIDWVKEAASTDTKKVP